MRIDETFRSWGYKTLWCSLSFRVIEKVFHKNFACEVITMSIKVINDLQIAKSSGQFLGVTLLDLQGPCDILHQLLKKHPPLSFWDTLLSWFVSRCVATSPPSPLLIPIYLLVSNHKNSEPCHLHYFFSFVSIGFLWSLNYSHRFKYHLHSLDSHFYIQLELPWTPGFYI